jgi:hypothetical protein
MSFLSNLFSSGESLSPSTAPPHQHRRNSSPDVSQEILASLSHTECLSDCPKIEARRAAAIYANQMDIEEELDIHHHHLHTTNSTPNEDNSPRVDKKDSSAETLHMLYPNRNHVELVYSTLPLAEPGMESVLFN